MKKLSIRSKIILLEVFSFACVVLIIWLNEIFDLPHIFFQAEITPINWEESLFESIFILILAIIIISITNRLFKKMKILEGLLPICASCKKIRDDKGYWKQVDTYIHEHSAVEFSHGLCDECSEKMYGNEDWYQKMKKDKDKKQST